MSNGEVPRDDNNAPTLGLWDPIGHQIVPAQAVSIVTDSTGQKYGTINVNASFSASSMAINDATIASQKAGVNAGGSLQVAGQGTAGTPAGGVISIQGVASGTAIPISGSITATNPSVSNTGAAVPASGTYMTGNKAGNLTGVSLDGSGNLNVNVAAGGSGSNASVGTDGSALPLSSTLVGASDGVNLQQLLVESAANRNLRTGIYSGANEATVTGANALKVDNSAVTQPVSGTITANAGTGNFTVVQATGTNLHVVADSGSTTAVTSLPSIPAGAATIGAVTQAGGSWTNNVTQVGGTNIVTGGVAGLLAVGGPVASAGANADNPVKIGGVFNTAQPTVTTGQIVDAQATARGAQIVATGVDAFAVNASQTGTWTVQPGNTANTTAWKVDGSAVTQPVSAASLPLPTGASTAAKQPALGTAGTASTDVLSVQGIASMTALKTDGSGVTQPVSGTVTATNPSVGSTGAAVPASGAYIAGNKAGNLTGVSLDGSGNLNVNVAAGGSGGTSSTFGAVFPATGTALGASDGTNMQGLLVESSSNKNLRVALYNGATEAGVTANGLAIQQATAANLNATATIQAVTGTSLAADQTNSELRVSNYVKTTTAGDTALTLGSATSANSLPVVIASNQSAVPISQPTSATGTLTSVAGTITASTQLLASNTSRKGMMVYNESTAILYLGFSATVTTASYTLQIPAQGFFEMPTAPVYTGVIAGVWSAAAGSARITELS